MIKKEKIVEILLKEFLEENKEILKINVGTIDGILICSKSKKKKKDNEKKVSSINSTINNVSNLILKDVFKTKSNRMSENSAIISIGQKLIAISITFNDISLIAYLPQNNIVSTVR